MPVVDYTKITLSRGDTVYKNKYGEYVFKGAVVSSKEMLDLMCHDEMAYKEMKKASSFYDSYFGAGLIGGLLATTLLKLPVDPTSKLLVCGSIAGATFLIATPLYFSYKKHIKRALTLFNGAHR